MQNLWGDLKPEEGPKPPVAILKEQADLLGKITNNIIEAKIVHSDATFLYLDPNIRQTGLDQGTLFYYDFVIIVPSLNEYTYKLFSIIYDIRSYPLLIKTRDEKYLPCKDEEEFTTYLQSIFSSSDTKQIINVLMAQAKAI